MEKKWFVFYTKSRHEEKVRDYLVRRGYEVYLPMQQVIRQWSDRKKKVVIPLFRSYIFVNIEEYIIQEVVKTPGIAWNVRYNNRPAELYPWELDTIKRFLDTGLLIEVSEAMDLKEGDCVKVADGPLKGIQGRIFHSTAGDKFTVTLATLGSSMLITLDSRLLQKVDH